MHIPGDLWNKIGELIQILSSKEIVDMILTPIVVGISDKIPTECEEIFGYLTGRMFMVSDKYPYNDA